eukprot:TRINITY_DN3687_c0_g1_i1.p1 TRINITY_DN3687_c0_g1~~TRINITY_DN3687_c0_g1_i1.p1  ORF type:complete len:771 (-),score=197.30 TRINITY_DN3687_c0_g1_i1:470-2782(-)
MRIMIKGGVWKNTEDEILKAAVMKYGKNQWARVSSLLVRKSAKQCKARWYEWLDPSIKKTEWSREEEEKLLHLAKLMPTQWRTIAPIIGRTPAQCLEHYEKLLDAAQGKDEGYDPADDPRRLRPGEIDPNPETKPARPDPVDMDEDEKEMLSEARARLANTKGKKAKRKAREKQLEEARRLAALQKRREMKAAGLQIRTFKRKQIGIDYVKEVPFEKKAPAGFYDTSAEDQRQRDSSFVNITLQQMEGQRRDEAEQRARREDQRKEKRKVETNLPAVIMQMNKLNDGPTITKRSKLVLPSPQITERELEEISKMGSLPEGLEDGEGGIATKTLLSNYGATPLPTPARTQMRTPAREDNIRREAQNLLALNTSSTPLAGGENMPLQDSDFSGATPRARAVQTPNVLATPQRTPTMITGAKVGGTPRRTPFRDDLNINQSSDMITQENLRIERAKQNLLRKELESSIKQLPTPKYKYKITAPSVDENDAEAGNENFEEDAADVDARKAAHQKEKETEEFLLRSSVVRSGLPRPVVINSMAHSSANAHDNMTHEEQAEALLREEIKAMLSHDAAAHPVKGPAQAVEGYAKYSLAELKAASDILAKETSEVRSLAGMGDTITPEMFQQAWEACYDELIYIPNSQRFARIQNATKTEKIKNYESQLEMNRGHMTRDSKRAVKLEMKVNLLTGGYQKRTTQLLEETSKLNYQINQLLMEHECFSHLQTLESRACPQRVEEWTKLVNEQKEIENELQLRYANLLQERDELRRSKIAA